MILCRNYTTVVKHSASAIGTMFLHESPGILLINLFGLHRIYHRE